MGKVRPKQEKVRFACDACGHRWEAEPTRVIDCEDDYHPWEYEADCPSCEAVAEQDPRQRRMLKMWARATGPKTPEGKARSAANLEGHPTPEEAKRTRFNALKHGMTAEVATFFPARPGRYDACEGCQYRANLCVDQMMKGGACLVRTELFFKHHLAFETGNPDLLKPLNADLQAKIRALIDMMYLDIVRRGVTLVSPKWYIDSDGEFCLAEYRDSAGERAFINEVNAHPLIRPLIEMISKNGMTLQDSGMTANQQTEEALIEGYIKTKQVEHEDESSLKERQTAALEHLGSLLEKADKDRAKDPILAEFNALEGPGRG